MTENSHKPHIKRCSCAHSYQDKQYGAQFRAHNEMKPLLGIRRWRCTVCGKEK